MTIDIHVFWFLAFLKAAITKHYQPITYIKDTYCFSIMLQSGVMMLHLFVSEFLYNLIK